jgi:molybdate transport system substrate-binding protein
MKHIVSIVAIIALLGFALPNTTRADEVKVAVAANFTPVIKTLQKQFEEKTGHILVASFGPSGGFYAQIKNGAPFDVFLSADAKRPQMLEDEKLAIEGSRFTYAVGKLALWSAKPDFVDEKGDILKKGDFAKLAIADPKTAPYGEAAMQTLDYLKLSDTLAPKIVQGVDISQAYQFVATGNADLGFVAYSQVIAKKDAKGSLWIVPQEYYKPIEQQAVLLEKSKDNKAAHAFLEFLKSNEARETIRSFGYTIQ